MPKSVEEKILSRVYGNRRGWAFSQGDFADLGNRRTVDSGLHRLARKKLIRRALRGVYHYPRYSEVLKEHLSPDVDQVAHAIARKFGWRIQPVGATAQNLLGLSTQVLGRMHYLSDGPDREYMVGKTPLVFEHAALKEAVFKLRESRLLVQALKSMGEDQITPKLISQLRNQFDRPLRQRILLDTKTATGWVYSAIQEIAKDPFAGPGHAGPMAAHASAETGGERRVPLHDAELFEIADEARRTWVRHSPR